MATTVQSVQTQLDTVVLKRLKFVFKIIKALIPQPNTRNRQAHVYIFEVLDAITDWSGNPNAELREMLDKQIFPQVCRLISTFSKDEFTSFQQFFSKYLFSKWEETSNYLVLDFVADIYAFIASIAPTSVSVELVLVFQQETVPPHVSLVILPFIIGHVSDTVAGDVSNKVARNFLINQKKEISSFYLKQVLQFWLNLKNILSHVKNEYQIAPILHQCAATSFYLEFFEDKDIKTILESLAKWSDSFSNWTVDSEKFLLISVIFLQSISFALLKKPNKDISTCVTTFMTLMVVLTEHCRNRRVRVFVAQVLQRTLEYAAENGIEVLSAFEETNEISMDDSLSDSSNKEVVLEALESSVKQITSEPNVKINELESRRIMIMIDRLQKLIETTD